MTLKTGTPLLAILLAAACSGASEKGEPDPTPDSAATAPGATQGMPHDSMPGMNHDSMPGMNHDSMPGMNHDSMPAMQHDSGQAMGGGMNHSRHAADGSMAGMDHSRPAPRGTSAGGGSMQGMDHSRMPGMSGTAGGAAPRGGERVGPSRMAGMRPAAGTADRSMQGMDHSRMAMPSGGSGRPQGSTAMQGMDHSRMQMDTPQRRASQSDNSTAAMDHANMAAAPGVTAPVRPGNARPARDADHAQHGAVSRVAVQVPEADAKLYRLAGRLVQDPLVQRQVQADSMLRNRWQDPGVRAILLTAEP